MPRFYFDHHDGDWDRDDIGTDLVDIDQAILQAKRTLPAIALDQLSRDGGHHTVTVLVSDEEGRPVYTAALAFTDLALSR